MPGEKDIHILLSKLNPILHDSVYVFCCLDSNQADRIDPLPLLRFRESERDTVVLPLDQAEKESLEYDFVSRKITLGVNSALDAIGLIARITTLLAKHGIAVNVVSAFHHDYLFVPSDKADCAMKILEGIERD